MAKISPPNLLEYTHKRRRPNAEANELIVTGKFNQSVHAARIWHWWKMQNVELVRRNN